MSIKKRQLNIIRKFKNFSNREEIIVYLIKLGRKNNNNLTKKYTINRIKGCQSNVWFNSNLSKKKIMFYGYSDTVIINGIVSLLLKIYNLSSHEEILTSKTTFIKNINSIIKLTPIRTNGFYEMIKYIYNVAKKKKKFIK